jgi:hypothetical protein
MLALRIFAAFVSSTERPVFCADSARHVMVSLNGQTENGMAISSRLQLLPAKFTKVDHPETVIRSLYVRKLKSMYTHCK